MVGKGGYGEIVQARDTEANKVVAIKYLNCDNLAKSDGLTLMYYREVSLLLQFTKMKENAHTSRLLDILFPPNFEVAEKKYIFLVMDFVEQDLLSFMESETFKEWSVMHDCTKHASRRGCMASCCM